MTFRLIHANGVERLRTLYSMLAGIPAAKVNLQYWRSDQDSPRSNVHACGTTACVVGFATAFPDFKEQGLGWSPTHGVPRFYGHMGFDAVEKFFGINYDDAKALFSLSTTTGRQINAEDRANSGNDFEKRRVLARIRNILLRNGSITKKRCDDLRKYEATLN